MGKKETEIKITEPKAEKQKDYQRKPKYYTVDESLANLIFQLGEGDPEVLSHLTKEEMFACALVRACGKWMQNDVLTELVNQVLKLSPAVRGMARKQLTRIGVASLGEEQGEDEGVGYKIKRKLGLVSE